MTLKSVWVRLTEVKIISAYLSNVSQLHHIIILFLPSQAKPYNRFIDMHFCYISDCALKMGLFKPV